MGKMIGEILVESGVISQNYLDYALIRQKKTDLRIGEFLVKEEAISRQSLSEALAIQWNMPMVSCNMVKKGNYKYRDLFGILEMRKEQFFIYDVSKRKILAAVVDPSCEETKQKIINRCRERAGKDVLFGVITLEDYSKCMKEYIE